MGKKSNGVTPGLTPHPLREAAKEHEASEKKRGKRGEQQRLPITDTGDREVKVSIELHRAMTAQEWDEQAAILAKHRVELMGLEDEIRRLKEKHAPRMKELRGAIDAGARQVDAREWLTLTPCIEVHHASTRQVATYQDLDGARSKDKVLPDRVMTDEEYERAIRDAPFAAPLEAPAGGQSEAP